MKALSVKNLKKTYSNHVQALKGIDLDVAAGDFFALLGPNGAGKTTLIGIVTTLVKKTGGSVAVFGHNLDTEPEIAKTYIGIVPQEFNFSIFEKVEQIVVNQAGYYGIPRKLAKQRAEKYLKILGLWDKRNAQARSLSGGMKRRLMIARAMVHEPELLILDEPTAGVDIEVRSTMWDFLRQINKEGKTIILTTHYLEEAESLCKHIAIVDKGEVIEFGKMSDLLARLRVETFILYLSKPLLEPPKLKGFDCSLVDEESLEVELSEGKTLTELLNVLTEKNIEVKSMRNKVNRLERLFAELVSTRQETS